MKEYKILITEDREDINIIRIRSILRDELKLSEDKFKVIWIE